MDGILQAIIGATVGLAVFVAGWPFQLIYIYLAIWGIDIITGVGKAMYNNIWESAAMRKGVVKKGLEIIVVLFVLTLQTGLSMLGIPIPAASILIGALILKEAGSVIENLLAVNNNLIPTSIQKYFKVAKDLLDSKINDEEDKK